MEKGKQRAEELIAEYAEQDAELDREEILSIIDVEVHNMPQGGFDRAVSAAFILEMYRRIGPSWRSTSSSAGRESPRGRLTGWLRWRS